MKMNQFEKALKGLQRVVEVEEGKQRSIKELVLELMEGGEEVNLISLSEEGPDQDQEGGAERQGAGVRRGGQEDQGQAGTSQGADGGGGGPEEGHEGGGGR